MKHLKKLLSILVVIMMLTGLTACGDTKPPTGNDEGEDEILLKVGKDYEILYKDAFITKDFNDQDVLVVEYDFTNKTSEKVTFFWAILDQAVQNDTELEYALIFYNETYDELETNKFIEIEKDESISVIGAYNLQDLENEVEIIVEDMNSDNKDSFTLDISKLSYKDVGTSEDGENVEEEPKGNATIDKAGGSDKTTGSLESITDWWNGEYYGWWVMTGCSGYYEGMDGEWWDVNGNIIIGDDNVGTVTLWDEDYSAIDPMASVIVNLSEYGTGPYGTLTSEEGWFTDISVEHADWIVDPALLDYEDMIWINGFYENGEDEYTYDIYLRPWGKYWDDVNPEERPRYYDDWYIPMIEAGNYMPDAIGEGM